MDPRRSKWCAAPGITNECTGLALSPDGRTDAPRHGSSAPATGRRARARVGCSGSVGPAAETLLQSSATAAAMTQKQISPTVRQDNVRDSLERPVSKFYWSSPRLRRHAVCRLRRGRSRAAVHITHEHHLQSIQSHGTLAGRAVRRTLQKCLSAVALLQFPGNSEQRRNIELFSATC